MPSRVLILRYMWTLFLCGCIERTSPDAFCICLLNDWLEQSPSSFVCQALHTRSYNHGRRLLRSYDINGLHGTAFPSPRTFDIGRGVTMNCYKFLCHVTLAPGTVATYGHWEVRLANTSFVGKTMKVMLGSTCFRWKSDVKWRPVQTAATP